MAPSLSASDPSIYQTKTRPTANESSQTVYNSRNSNRNTIKKSNEYVTSQENSSSNSFTNTNSNGNKFGFPNNRNRFHPLSTTKKPSFPLVNRTTQQTSTIAPATNPSTPKEVNDEIGATVQNVRGSESRATTVSPRGETATNIRVNKLLRQPLFSNRETTQQPSKRINITHNGSSNREGSQEVSNRTHQLQLLQRARQRFRGASAENSAGSNENISSIKSSPISSQSAEIEEEEKDFLNYDEKNESKEENTFFDDEDEGIPERITTKSIDENKPVILTSNFFLPGKPAPNLNQNSFENEQPNELASDISENASQSNENGKSFEEQTLPPVKTVEKKTEPKAEVEKKATTPPKTLTTAIKPVTEEFEYEYEYEDYIDETTTVRDNPITAPPPTPAVSKRPDDTKDTKQEVEFEENSTIANNDDQVTVDDTYETEVTLRSQAMDDIDDERTERTIEPIVDTSSASPTASEENAINSTESYVVVASVQTSRSISGARFLTFPQVEQEQKKQALGEEGKSDDNDEHDESELNDQELTDAKKADDLVQYQNVSSETESIDESTETSSESSVDLDANTTLKSTHEIAKTKVQKLSSVSEKLAHLHGKSHISVDVSTKAPPVVIRKFMPHTTKSPPRKSTTTRKSLFEPDAELASLLPPGFKYRANESYKTSTQPTTTTKPFKTSTASVPFNIKFEEIAIDSLLPKDYKPVNKTKPKVDEQIVPINITNLLAKIKKEENFAKLLPNGYKASTLSSVPTTKAPLHLSTVTENISKFLPPDFKLPKEKDVTTSAPSTKRPLLKTTMDDVSKFLPPGYKLPRTTSTTEPTKSAEKESASSESDKNKNILNKIKFSEDISNLFPPGYKSDISSLFPAGYKPPSSTEETASAEQASSTTTNTTSNNYKIVFPKSIGKRPGLARMTTPKPAHIEGPVPPNISIRKGLPTRYKKLIRKHSE